MSVKLPRYEQGANSRFSGQVLVWGRSPWNGLRAIEVVVLAMAVLVVLDRILVGVFRFVT